MGRLLEIVTPLHQRTSRDYLGRMMDDKVHCMTIAKEYGRDYWDGDRRFGYGGYRYDGRWAPVAEALIREYRLQKDASILDVGCGKAFLLYELSRLLPHAHICGLDASPYAIKNAKPEIRDRLVVHRAEDRYPFADKQFDLAISLTTLHNLPMERLAGALQEMDRVSRNQYVVVESFRNDRELFNLQCWALTCESFHQPESWKWIFDKSEYRGDYEFIYFT